MTNLQKYLLGNEQQDKNVIGTVLGLSTTVKTENKTKLPKQNPLSITNNSNRISIFMFLDFRTGRIERYLINVSNLGVLTSPDFKEDVDFTLHGERYKMFHEFDLVPQTKTWSLMNIDDGKLTKLFNFIFMVDLIRDYLLWGYSYNDGNTATLRKLTTPKTPIQYSEDNPEELKTSSSGTGKLRKVEIEEIKTSGDYSIKEFYQFNAERFINYEKRTSDNKYTILVPHNFKNPTTEQLFNHSNYDLSYAHRSELPPIVREFTISFYIKNISCIHSVSSRIKTWNCQINKKLKKL